MLRGGRGGRHSPELYPHTLKCSNASDTSSAYSGSDTMTSVHSSLDMDMEVDLSGLLESIVDSDEEEDMEEEILIVRDAVRECLEKDPSERTDDDIETLLEFTRHLTAFTNMTLTVRRALCAVMVFAVVEKAGTVVMNDGEEHDSWSVLINGHVGIEHANGEIEHLNIGDSFGMAEATLEKLYHRGVMTTRCDDCQFVCVTQTDYYRILHQGEENIRRHENDNGVVVLVTEYRGVAGESGRQHGHVVIRGTPEQLMLQLVEDNSRDSTYVEDFLLTHRTFIESPLVVAKQLLAWFSEPSVRDKVTRVVLLWVNNHFTDFETDPNMMEFLENFEISLERENMESQLRLLNIACSAKARTRSVTLSRPSRDEPLYFTILGGYERGYGIFIFKVEKHSKAEDVGFKRGDQILEVNGQSFQHVSHAKAMEIITGSTHLSITVKSNLLAFKQMLSMPENSPRQRGGANIVRWQTDPRARLSTAELLTDDPITLTPSFSSPTKKPQQNSTKKETQKNFMTLGPKRKLQKALMKMNLLPKNTISDGLHTDDSVLSNTESLNRANTSTSFYSSHSNPDLISICYDEYHSSDYPEHVLKVYRPDQTCKYLLVHKETTAREVVMLSVKEFGISDPSSNFSLCEVSVAQGGIIKQHRLPDQLQNLAERIGLSSRYYLKTNGISETLVPDDMAPELLRESVVHFLQLNAVEVAVQLTLQDFCIFRQIESTEYVDDLFELKSRYGTPMLSQFAELVNKEMFWVVTEVVNEQNLVRRSKIIKQFIKVARHCKECKNFNSMFAIISGLGHGAVSRLRMTWEKLPTKYYKLFTDLQMLMDPSRNMSKYRQLVTSEQGRSPVIPFYPVVKKDLTFIHLGNDTKVEGMVNFEKLRMIAKEVRTLTNMCSSPYDLLTLLELGNQPPSNAMVALNQLTTGVQQGQVTVKRRKKSSNAPNQKKMFEEAQMVRRVKAYLNRMHVETDEERLHALSIECEGAGPAPTMPRRRHPSPSLSTTSSASSASESKKSFTGNKFGTASPQAVRKLLALSEPAKTRPHQPRPPPPPSGPSPSLHRRDGPMPGICCPRSAHERSHSDTPTPLPVDLSAESSSVTSLVNLPLKKTGSVTSNDSGHVSCTVQSCTRPVPPPRMPQPQYMPHTLVTQVARLERLSRAHSHEGVTRSYDYYHDHPDDEDDDQQVSAV
ncbi:rap guanine nucleotide exchange factor 2 [Bombyx mandarina]|uniref:Rap guanine nucleotide exchange factor 2 n=2 Tax=Bombyx TaxID=7090 RepID=A0A8R2AS52_BOMMO|nr:rap guanine nucleotide exchange factor 2 [Bombyx mori]XP_028026715.1 rap guanine nucleotide exchange factor 2 [Bombyx mandarina]